MSFLRKTHTGNDTFNAFAQQQCLLLLFFLWSELAWKPSYIFFAVNRFCHLQSHISSNICKKKKKKMWVSLSESVRTISLEKIQVVFTLGSFSGAYCSFPSCSSCLCVWWNGGTLPQSSFQAERWGKIHLSVSLMFLSLRELSSLPDWLVSSYRMTH